MKLKDILKRIEKNDAELTEVELDELENDDDAVKLNKAIGENSHIRKLIIKDQSKLGLPGQKLLIAINTKVEKNLQEYTQKKEKLSKELAEKEKVKQEKLMKEAAEREKTEALIKEAAHSKIVKLITHAEYDKALAKDIATAISNNTHVEEIVIGEVTASYEAYNNMHYTDWNDEGCFINNEILHAIAGVLKKGDSLKKLTFISTYCDDGYLAEVFEAIAHNRSLQTLEFVRRTYNYDFDKKEDVSKHVAALASLGDKAARALAKSLELNTSLHTLRVSFFSQHGKKCEDLARALEKNRTLKNLYLENSMTREDLYPKLLKLLNNLLLTNSTLINIDVFDDAKGTKPELVSMIKQGQETLKLNRTRNAVAVVEVKDSAHASPKPKASTSTAPLAAFHTTPTVVNNTTSISTNSVLREDSHTALLKKT